MPDGVDAEVEVADEGVEKGGHFLGVVFEGLEVRGDGGGEGGVGLGG